MTPISPSRRFRYFLLDTRKLDPGNSGTHKTRHRPRSDACGTLTHSGAGSRCREQFLHRYELETRPAGRRSARTSPACRSAATRGNRRTRAAARRRGSQASRDRRRVRAAFRREVVEDLLDGLVGALLVGADDAGRSALDPPGDVDTRDRLTGLGVDDATVLVREHAAALVERHVGDGGAPVPDRPQHQSGAERLGRRRVGRASRRPSTSTSSLRYEA